MLSIGYALDLDGDPTVTLGIVSALDRTLGSETGALKGLIQTRCSGVVGQLRWPAGQRPRAVVGITTLASTTALARPQTGLASPSPTAELLPEMRDLRAQANGDRASGYLGVNWSAAPMVAVALWSPKSWPAPAAEKAGIRVGDVVVQSMASDQGTGRTDRHDPRPGPGDTRLGVAGREASHSMSTSSSATRPPNS